MLEKITLFFQSLDATSVMSLILSFAINNYLAIGYFFLALYSIKHKMRMLDRNQDLDEKKVETDTKKLDVELERLKLENDKLKLENDKIKIENDKLEAEVDTVEINNDKLKLTIQNTNKDVNTD